MVPQITQVTQGSHLRCPLIGIAALTARSGPIQKLPSLVHSGNNGICEEDKYTVLPVELLDAIESGLRENGVLAAGLDAGGEDSEDEETATSHRT